MLIIFIIIDTYLYQHAIQHLLYLYHHYIIIIFITRYFCQQLRNAITENTNLDGHLMKVHRYLNKTYDVHRYFTLANHKNNYNIVSTYLHNLIFNRRSYVLCDVIIAILCFNNSRNTGYLSSGSRGRNKVKFFCEIFSTSHLQIIKYEPLR